MNNYDYISYDQLTGMNRYLVDLREQRMARYIADPKDLLSRVNSEIQTRDDYSGREILELLQNAVDASPKRGKIIVELQGDILKVYNHGDPFTEGGIDSILIPNLSPKNEFENLGNKGLGFRSLLNGSAYITIQSHGLSVRMSQADARVYKKLANLPVIPPILSAPRVIAPLAKLDFATIIECKIKDASFIDQIKNQIESISDRSIIFLPKISAIELRIDDQVRTISKTTAGQICTVKVSTNEDITKNTTNENTIKNATAKNITHEDTTENTTNAKTTVTKYYIAQKDITRVDSGNLDETGNKIYKDIHITIARNLDDERPLNDRWDYLYNAFPTKVTMPTGWIINANFGVNADRNAINAKSYNWRALTAAIDLIFEEAEKLAQKTVNFDALKTLMGNYEKFSFNFSDQSLQEYFMAKLLHAKLLPGANGNYLSLAEKPYFYYYNLTQYLHGDGFEKTVTYCDDQNIDTFMKKYINPDHNDHHRMSRLKITPLINARLDAMSIADQINLSVLFMNEYPAELKPLPNFFLDQNNQRIHYDTEKYTESESSVAKNVPSFLNIQFIKKSYITEIHQQINVSAKDFESSDYAKYYNIKQYRLLNIARSYKSAIENHPTKAYDYLVWLYENEIPAETITKADLADVKIPTKSGGAITVANGILPNGIYEELFPDSKYIIKTSDRSDKWHNFLLSIGVQDFPSFFEKDFTEKAFQNILAQNPLEQIHRLLNTKTWLTLNSVTNNLINNTPWIEYNDQKYAPRQIILNSEYDQKFDHLLGIEETTLQDLLLLEPHVFSMLDFRESIVKMPIPDIYAILTQLPTKDHRGKLAKKIYRALATSLDDKNLSGTNYSNFITNGQVFCKDGHYHPVSETVYFAQGLLPSAALKNQNLIEVDKKRGAEKVKNIFGVKKLTVDFYINHSQPHTFQPSFSGILTQIKIGILATEKLNLADESKHDIKSLRIHLCRAAEVIINGEVKILEDYEFASKKNTPSEYYIKIPEAGQSFDTIRHQPIFTNALTEMFVMRIGTSHAEENSDSIARIIEANPENMKQIIELQENGTERYQAAAQLMDIPIEITTTTENEIDVLYEQNLQNLKTALHQLEPLYLQNLYHRLLHSPIAEQSKFESLRNAFLNYVPDDEILLTKDFNADQHVHQHFSLQKNLKNDTGETNWQKAVAQFGEQLNPHDDLKSLARFGYFAEIQQQLAEHEKRLQELQTDIDNGVIPAAREVTRNPAPTTQKTKSTTGNIRRGGFGGGGGASVAYKNNIGYLGQQIVLKHLRAKGYLHAEDQSGYAIRTGTNVNASDSYGYDIICEDANGITHYIEVKAHADRIPYIAFEMSKNEYETAQKLSRTDNSVYEIYLVDGVDTTKYDTPEIQIFNFLNIEGKMSPEEPKKYFYNG